MAYAPSLWRNPTENDENRIKLMRLTIGMYSSALRISILRDVDILQLLVLGKGEYDLFDLLKYEFVGHVEIRAHVMAENLGHYAVVLDVLLLYAASAITYMFSARPGMKVEAAEPPRPPIIFVKSAISNLLYVITPLHAPTANWLGLGRRAISEYIKLNKDWQIEEQKSNHRLRYFFLRSTTSSPFHLLSSPSFLPRSSSSSGVHSTLLSPLNSLSNSLRSPDTLSSLLRRLGRVVLYSRANTLRTVASSPTDSSVLGSETRWLGLLADLGWICSTMFLKACSTS